MKKCFKILSLLIAFVLMVSVFTACDKENKLIVATNAEFEPFEYKDNKDNLIGFDIDLINKIAEKIDMEVEFKNMEFDSIVGSVQSGASSVSVSGMTITEKRLKNVDFSDPYYNASQVVIVRTDDTVVTGTTKEEIDEQLKNKTIGVCAGFTGGTYVEGDEKEDIKPIEGATKKEYDNINLAMQDLKNGQIDAIIMDDVVAKRAAEAEQNKKDVKVINVPLTTEQYGIAIGKDKTELKDKINKALKELKDEGFIDELIERWINK